MNESTYESTQATLNGNRLIRLTNQSFVNRPTLVFLHDSLGSIQLWRDFPIKLGQAVGCNILVYERRGHGESAQLVNSGRTVDYLERQADSLEELLNHCEIDDAILFGHSDGGSIALLAAAKFGHCIRAVIAEAAHIFVEEITLEGIKQAVIQYETGDLKSRLSKYHKEKTETLFWLWANTWLSPAYRNWTIVDFLPSIQCRVLIIQGEKDEYGTLGQVEGIANQITGVASQFIVPDVGHTPHKEATTETLLRTAQFILEMLK
jgi:pimeloyl-ACP methyl ester carboxylesterase